MQADNRPDYHPRSRGRLRSIQSNFGNYKLWQLQILQGLLQVLDQIIHVLQAN